MTGTKRGKLALVAVAVLGAWALVAAAAAQANTVTVGSALPPGAVSEPVGEVQTFLNTALPEKGASVASPATGVVVRWRLQGAKAGPFYLRVLRPNGLGAYTAVGTSNPVTAGGPGLQTFAANVPIKAGDLLAVDVTNPTDELGFATAAGASFTTIFPTPFEGATVPAREPKSGKEVELSAEVQPTPAVTEISPSAGSVTGGIEVKITGTNFTGASAVKFDTVPAASIKVESDTEIIATAPKSAKTGAFDGAGCKVGKVTKRHGVSKQTGKVKQQNPKAGKVLAKGTAVKVTLG